MIGRVSFSACRLEKVIDIVYFSGKGKTVKAKIQKPGTFSVKLI